MLKMKLINGVCLFVCFKLTPGRNNTVEQLASLQYEDYAAQNCGLFPIIWAHVSRLSCPLYQIYKSCFCSGLLSICLFIHPSISVWCLHRLDKHKSPIRQHVLFSEKEHFAVLASCCIKASCFFLVALVYPLISLLQNCWEDFAYFQGIVLKSLYQATN